MMNVRLVSITNPDPGYVSNMDTTLEGLKVSPEDILVHIARVSSGRTNTLEDPVGLINYLIKNQHWSPFEHTFITFEITTSLPIATQYLRHRSFTFQQFSQRYAKVNAVEPVELRIQAETNRQSSTDVIGSLSFFEEEDKWNYEIHEPDGNMGGFREVLLEEMGEAICTCLDTYDNLIDAGVAKETARMVLPQATQTKLYMSGPLRSWIHLIELREDAHSQVEAQNIAKAIKVILKDKFPLTSAAIGW